MFQLVPCILLLLTLPLFGSASVWEVGPTRTYTLPSQVSNLVQDGDTILLDAGYYHDAVKWSNNDLKIIGLGDSLNRTVIYHSGNIPNGKGIFVFETPGTCDNPYIDNIVFDGAQVSDADGGNGAGIRFQAVNLTVNNCKFMNCQNGILEGNAAVTSSSVIIANSEFENNGYQLPNDPVFSGYSHHIYIGASADTLVVGNCYFHRPRGQGNSIKTRAQRNYINHNLIDESNGYGSWELNIAQGGLCVILGNIIIQGTAGANHGIISYDAATNALQDFYFVNNTVVNTYAGNNRFFSISPSAGINTFKIWNNIFSSVPGASNTLIGGNTPGTLDSLTNLVVGDYLNVGFSNPSQNDFRLTATSTDAIDQGTAAGFTNTGYPLLPEGMYIANTVAPAPRVVSGAAVDIGAYEFQQAVSTDEMPGTFQIHVYPNPAANKIYISKPVFSNEIIALMIFNQEGKTIFREEFTSAGINEVDVPKVVPGIYFVACSSSKFTVVNKITIR